MPEKKLKFESHLVDKILSGEKTNTWRLFDDKDLQAGDIVIFIRRPELTPFAQAKIIKVTEKPLAELNEDDWQGHEKYDSNEELYWDFSKYYETPVTSQTPVKIVKFQVLT
jgi:hypothetical protein